MEVGREDDNIVMCTRQIQSPLELPEIIEVCRQDGVGQRDPLVLVCACCGLLGLDGCTAASCLHGQRGKGTGWRKAAGIGAR